MANLETVIRPWQYSVKLETNAKGFIQPSVHVYSDESKDVWLTATRLLDALVDELKTSGYKVATDLKQTDTAEK